MITKKELLSLYIGALDEIEELAIRVDKLEHDFKKVKSCACGKNTDGVKRKPGRPRKNS